MCVCVHACVRQSVHCFVSGFVHTGLGTAKGTLRGTATRPTLMGLWRSNGFRQRTRELTCVWSAMWQEEKRAKYEWRSKVGVALSHNCVVLFENEPCCLHDLWHFFFSEPTLIVTKPKSMKVIHGTDVRFECGVKADATATVTTTWMKGNRPLTLGWRCILLVTGSDTQKTQRSTVPGYLELIAFISFFSVPRISLDESNLIITNVNKGDEGNYTCVIKSELEEKSASARLMVMGMAGLIYYDIIL